MQHATLRLGVALAASILTAHAQEQSQMLHLTFVSVNPGMGPDFEEMQKTINDASRKQGTKRREVWTTAIFGEPMYVTVFPVASMATYDSPNPMRASMNDIEYSRFVQRMSRIVRGARQVMVRTRPDLGISSGEHRPNTMAVATSVNVMYGKQAEFERYLKNEVMAALRRAGVKDAWVHQTVMGGPMTEYTLLTPFDKWESMENGSPLERTLGPDGLLALRAKAAGTVTSIQNVVTRRIETLGYMPAQPATGH